MYFSHNATIFRSEYLILVLILFLFSQNNLCAYYYYCSVKNFDLIFVLSSGNNFSLFS